MARRSAASPPARVLPLGALRAAIASLARHRRVRGVLLGVPVVLMLLAGGFLWFRDSSFVSVQRVRIAGVQGPDARAVEAALTQAARGMSTLDVNTGALLAAVVPLRVVRALSAIPSFPHGLRIEVGEQLPVAVLTVAGVHTAVAADGVALGPALASSSLPDVSGSWLPAPGRRVGGASLLAALAVLGSAPAPLARHVERVFTGARGVTAAMRNGLLVYFGDATRALAKWLSLARVLADPGSAGASYVDVRVPSHPAAGFPAGVSPPDAAAAAGTGSGEQQAGTESTVAAIAAALPGAGTSTSATEASATATGATGASGTESTSGSQAPTSTGGEVDTGHQSESPTVSGGG